MPLIWTVAPAAPSCRGPGSRSGLQLLHAKSCQKTRDGCFAITCTVCDSQASDALQSNGAAEGLPGAPGADQAAICFIDHFLLLPCRVDALQAALASLTGLRAAEQIVMCDGRPLEAVQPLSAYQLPLVRPSADCSWQHKATS